MEVCFNPAKTMCEVYSDNDNVRKLTHLLDYVSYNLHKILTNLYTEMLRENTDSSSRFCKKAINYLQDSYKPVVESLDSLGFHKPKSYYDSWQLLWMLDKIKDGTLVDDEVYAHSLGLPFTDTDRVEMKDLRGYWLPDEIDAEE